VGTQRPCGVHIAADGEWALQRTMLARSTGVWRQGWGPSTPAAARASSTSFMLASGSVNLQEAHDSQRQPDGIALTSHSTMHLTTSARQLGGNHERSNRASSAAHNSRRGRCLEHSAASCDAAPMLRVRQGRRWRINDQNPEALTRRGTRGGA
jgi:hypothetical protein